MSLVKWDPFRNIFTLQDRINRLFEDAFPRTAATQEDMTVCAWQPQVDIFETVDNIILQVDLPGVKKEDVAVEIKDNTLTIKGERQAETTVGDENYFRRERSCGTFQRSFALRTMIAPDKIKASFKNGVLKIEIPKPEEEKPKQVTVKID